MSDPETWTTKDPNTVQAKFFAGSDEQRQDVMDWVAPFLTAEDSIYWGPTGYGSMYIQIGADYMFVQDGSYVYLDEDGIHVASKGAFEMVYEKDAPA